MPGSLSELVSLTADATREAVIDLFGTHRDERFYYISLICSGSLPFLSAWSVEALARVAADQGCDPAMIKWSYADSPYCGYRVELFDRLRDRFDAAWPSSSPLGFEHPMELAAWVAERVMSQLDREGVFGAGESRDRLVVAAEVMPPDVTNIARVTRLNSATAIAAWLHEAAETGR